MARKKNFGRSIFLLMCSTLASRLLGFLRNALISFYFGAGGQADVLNIVLALPNNLRRLLAEGSLGNILVPELSRLFKKNQQQQAERLLASLLSIQAFLLFPCMVMLIFFPQQLAHWFFRFPDPSKIKAAAQLLPLLAPFLFLVSCSIILGTAFDAANRFILTALTPLLSSLTVVSFILFAHDIFSIKAVLYGLLLGTFLQTLSLFIGLRSLKFSIFYGMFINDSLKRVLKLWFPVWLCSSLVAINQQIATIFASRLNDGSTSLLIYSLLFFQLPYGIFYASIARVSLPQISRNLEQGHAKAQLAPILNFALSNVVALLIPAGLFLFLFRYELIAVTFQRGQFNLTDTQGTAAMLGYYSWGLVAIGCYDLMQRSFFAANLGSIPLIFAALVLAVDVSLSLILLPYLEVEALALANTLTFFINGFAIVWLLNKKICRFLNRQSLFLLLRVLLSCSIVWMSEQLLKPLFPVNWWHSGASWLNLCLLILHASALLLILLLSYSLLKIPVLGHNLPLSRHARQG